MPICMHPTDLALLALLAAMGGAATTLAWLAIWDRISEGPIPPEDKA